MNSISDTVNETKKIEEKNFANNIYRTRFGVPSRDCAGMGICDVFRLDPKKYDIEDRYALTKISYRSNRLSMEFDKNSMTAKTKELYFGRKIFAVEEDFDLTTAIALDESFIIRKGRYDIEEKRDVFVVVFEAN